MIKILPKCIYDNCNTKREVYSKFCSKHIEAIFTQPELYLLYEALNLLALDCHDNSNLTDKEKNKIVKSIEKLEAKLQTI